MITAYVKFDQIPFPEVLPVVFLSRSESKIRRFNSYPRDHPKLALGRTPHWF